MGQLKIIELTETYTGIRFQDFEKIQSESQFLYEKHLNVSKPTRLGTFLFWGYSEILFKVCLFLATILAGQFSMCVLIITLISRIIKTTFLNKFYQKQVKSALFI
jgi:uncharacterized membrane protein